MNRREVLYHKVDDPVVSGLSFHCDSPVANELEQISHVETNRGSKNCFGVVFRKKITPCKSLQEALDGYI
jgi:hypothetical protein